LVEAGRGDLDHAVSVLEKAVAVHNESPIPLERGRTLLALGQSLRRRRAKARAISTLQQALDCFTDLGATPFIELAQGELTTFVGAPKDAPLTAAERRVAISPHAACPTNRLPPGYSYRYEPSKASLPPYIGRPAFAVGPG